MQSEFKVLSEKEIGLLFKGVFIKRIHRAMRYTGRTVENVVKEFCAENKIKYVEKEFYPHISLAIGSYCHKDWR